MKVVRRDATAGSAANTDDQHDGQHDPDRPGRPRKLFVTRYSRRDPECASQSAPETPIALACQNRCGATRTAFSTGPVTGFETAKRRVFAEGELEKPLRIAVRRGPSGLGHQPPISDS